MTHLLHPELFGKIPFQGNSIARVLERQAREVEQKHASQILNSNLKDPNITIAIRTLNEANSLEDLFRDITKQAFDGEVEVVVVDNESTDDTKSVARGFEAEVVTLPRDDFTYPYSMNLGMTAASHDIVLLTVGHARLSNNQSLRGAARHYQIGNLGGVYGSTLPNENASMSDRLSVMPNRWLFRSPKLIKSAGMGVLGATGAMVSKPIWLEMECFDEQYESGGEDTALAAKMLDRGYHVIREPLLAVHHSHGLSPLNSLRQLQHWARTVKGPMPLDRQALAARRPDLQMG